MNTEAVLKQKRLQTTKRHFAYVMPDAMKRLEVCFIKPELPKAQVTPSELLTYLSQDEICELYPNLWVPLWIACTQAVYKAELFQAQINKELLEIFHGTRKTECTGSDLGFSGNQTVCQHS